MTDELLEPQVWDYVYYQNKERLKAIADKAERGGVARSAHAYLNLYQDAQGTLEMLEGADSPPSLGVRLLALCEQQKFDDVLNAEYKPSGSSPLELENTTYCEWAISIAYAQRENFKASLQHIERSIFSARCLGLEGRLRVLLIEQSRQKRLAGELESIREVVDGVFFSQDPQVARFGMETYLENLLGLDYKARSQVEQKRLKYQYGEARKALKQLGVPPHIVPLPPQTEGKQRYTELLNASALALQGENNLSRLYIPTDTPVSFQVWADALAWALWLRTGEIANQRPLSLPEKLRQQLEKYDSSSTLASWITYLVPDEMMVLHLAGLAYPEVSAVLRTHPVLSQGEVRFGTATKKLPEAVTEALILDGLEGTKTRYDCLYRSQQKRYRDTLKEYDAHMHEVINPGAVLRSAEFYASFARRYGRETDVNAAESAVRQSKMLLPQNMKL